MSEHFSEWKFINTEKFIKDGAYFFSYKDEVSVEFMNEIFHWEENEVPSCAFWYYRTALRSDTSVEDLRIEKFSKKEIISMILSLYFYDIDILSELERNIFPTEEGEIFSLCFNGENFDVFSIESRERLNFGTLIFHKDFLS